MAFHNYGAIDAVNFRGYAMHNYGSISTYYYEYNFMTNHGVISITDPGYINLGYFDLKKGGKLNINGLSITYGEKLEPELLKYLQLHGSKVVVNADVVSFQGKFKVDLAELRKILPHKFSKYDDTGSNYEWKPGAWLPNSFSSAKSISKTGVRKNWRVAPIDTKTYTQDTATTDVFCGKLAKRLSKSAIVPKVTLDVFNKAVMTQILTKSTCASVTAQDAAKATLRDKIGRILVTAKSADLKTKLSQLIPKPVANTSLFNLPSIFKSSPPVLSTDEVLATIDSTLDTLAADNGNISEEIVAEVSADFNKVNNKFTSDEIDKNMLPTLNQCALNLNTNIKLAQDVLAILKQPANSSIEAQTSSFKTPTVK